MIELEESLSTILNSIELILLLDFLKPKDSNQVNGIKEEKYSKFKNDIRSKLNGISSNNCIKIEVHETSR